MPTIHVYVREQITGSPKDLRAIEQAAKALQAAVEAAGSDWHGGVSLELPPVVAKTPTPAFVPEPPEPPDEPKPHVKRRSDHDR